MNVHQGPGLARTGSAGAPRAGQGQLPGGHHAGSPSTLGRDPARAWRRLPRLPCADQVAHHQLARAELRGRGRGRGNHGQPRREPRIANDVCGATIRGWRPGAGRLGRRPGHPGPNPGAESSTTSPSRGTCGCLRTRWMCNPFSFTPAVRASRQRPLLDPAFDVGPGPVRPPARPDARRWLQLPLADRSNRAGSGEPRQARDRLQAFRVGESSSRCLRSDRHEQDPTEGPRTAGHLITLERPS